MRCVECQMFQRLDTRMSPSEVVCGKFPHGIGIDPHRGCGMGKLKPKGSNVWKQGGGSSWNKA